MVNQCMLLRLYAYGKGFTANYKQQCWKQSPICLLTAWLLECLQGSTVNKGVSQFIEKLLLLHYVAQRRLITEAALFQL